MQNNPMNDSIDNIKNFQKKMEEASANTEEVKSGDIKKEDEQQDPAYILYNAISNNSIEILNSPTIQSTFETMSEKMGDDFTKKFIEMMVVIMTNSAHSAVVLYDEMLKKELTESFNKVGDGFSTVCADVNAHTGVLEIFKKRLEIIEKKLNLNEIKGGGA